MHDFYTCSTHAPVQVSFETKCNNFNEINILTQDKNTRDCSKLKWTDDKYNLYMNVMSQECSVIEDIVDRIIMSDINLNNGIDMIAEKLYGKAYDDFGSNYKISS